MIVLSGRKQEGGTYSVTATLFRKCRINSKYAECNRNVENRAITRSAKGNPLRGAAKGNLHIIGFFFF